MQTFLLGLSRANEHLTRHPRHLLAAVLVLLGGFAAAAIAVAPASLNSEPVAQRIIEETLSLPSLDAQAEALAAHAQQFTRTTLTREADTPEALLRRLGVSDAQAAQAMRSDAIVQRLLLSRPGRLVQARTHANGQLAELVGRLPALAADQLNTHFTRLVLSKQGDLWLPTMAQVELQRAVRMGSGTIQTTLFAATDDARIPDDVAVKLAEIFASEIDFHRDIHRGDRFSVLYEAMVADGEPVGWSQSPGRVMAAEFANRGKLHQAMWFATGPGGKGEYFGFDGRSHRRAFLASPLEFSRVSSGFAMRIHPITKTWRAHLGVDYAAPTGTAVRTVGDGVVEFAGRQSGYGNVVQIKHRGDTSTLYAHLSRIDVQVGQKVEQGQLVGAVGATGWATGPHLHFEFRVKGEHQDPQTLAQVAEAAVLDAASKQRFGDLRTRYESQLQAAATLGGARSRFE